MSKINNMVDIARSYVGVPYRDKGRNRLGVDCIGLIILAAQEAGLTTYDTVDYPRRPIPLDFIRGIKEHCDRVPQHEARHGDIFMFAEPRHPCHVGLLDVDPSGVEYILHAYALARKVVRDRLTEERRARILMVWRLPTEEGEDVN